MNKRVELILAYEAHKQLVEWRKEGGRQIPQKIPVKHPSPKPR